MPYPFGWMYNITCTGSCSASRHAHQKILAVLHLPPTQTSVICCSTFVSVVFHIAKAVSNEEGAHPGLHDADCPRDRVLSGMGRSPLTSATLLLQLAHRDSRITRWCSCTYGKLFGSQHLRCLRLSLNLVLHMTSWTKQHSWWLRACYTRRDAWWEQHLQGWLSSASLCKKRLNAARSQDRYVLRYCAISSWCLIERHSLEQTS